MGTATAVPVRGRATTKLVTPTIFKQWVADLRSGKYALRPSGHGINFLTLIETGGKQTWQYDVFGLLFDRVADTWVKGRTSTAHKNTTYYNPMLNGTRLGLGALLPDRIIVQLAEYQRAGRKAAVMADFIESNKSLICG